MPDKGQVISRRQVWLEPNEKGELVETAPPTPGGLFGWGATGQNAVLHEIIVYENGEFWDRQMSPDGTWSEPAYQFTDPQLAANWRASQPEEPKAPKVEWTGEEGYVWDPDLRQYVPAPGLPSKQTAAGTPTVQWVGDQAYIWDPTAGPSGSWVRAPGLPTKPAAVQQLAPRYPEEEELARLNVEKARRDLMNPYALAMQQQEEAIAAIQQKLAAGQITPQEADRQMQLIKANINATLMGTSPWQMRQQQQNLASNILSDRMTTGSSLASSLLSGAGNIYGRILSGHGAPTGFNPLAMAQGFVQEMGGGPELTALAKAILTGALQQSAQGGW